VLGGHSTVRYGGRACSCGNVGCAEAEASTAFLAELARADSDFVASRLAREPVLDFAAVFRQAAAGDVCAMRLRDHSLLVWSTLAVNLIHAYDPEIVILGGGIMASADVILPAVSDYVRRHAHTPWGKVRVVASELGDRAALVAGEWLVQEQFPNLK
jgi:glucokinase